MFTSLNGSTFQTMELPKTEEIPVPKGQDGQEPEDSHEKNELKNDITKVKVESVEVNGTCNINGGLTNNIDISKEVKKEIDGAEISTKSKVNEPLENGVGSKVEETEITAPTDREFVLTTKNLERVREELRQEEVLQGKKSPLKSVSASPSIKSIKSACDEEQRELQVKLMENYVNDQTKQTYKKKNSLKRIFSKKEKSSK